MGYNKEAQRAEGSLFWLGRWRRCYEPRNTAQDLGQVRKCVLPYSLPRRNGLVDTPVSASETYFRQSICVALGAEFVMIHYGSNRKRIYLFIPSNRFLRAGTLLAHLL